jgi:hypothetical protein
MAQTSKNGSSLRPPRHDPRDESWKTAPSRESTHDDPEGENQRIERESKRLENTPGADDNDKK